MMSVNVQELVDAGVFPNADAAIREALRVLWQERPGMRIDVAVHRYVTESISIAKAAAIAGVPFDRMKEILAERGVELRLGPELIDEAKQEADTLRKMRS
jgi:predicted HTH domain antitoxin